MTQEEKSLLLKDLCARLPYGVIIQEYNEEYGYSDNALNTIGIGYFSIHEACIEDTWINRIENIKPYLHPMSSITDKEVKEYLGMLNEIDKSGLMNQNFITKVVDWLDKKMFDHRDLIPIRLALEAPEDMYK